MLTVHIVCYLFTDYSPIHPACLTRLFLSSSLDGIIFQRPSIDLITKIWMFEQLLSTDDQQRPSKSLFIFYYVSMLTIHTWIYLPPINQSQLTG